MTEPILDPPPGATLGVALAGLTASGIDPLFWRVPHRHVDSAWWQHVPFAWWVVTTAEPNVLAELGTHNGVSYLAFCEAVQRSKLATRCYAVDTWEGDEHAGFYDDDVYQSLLEHNARQYGAFSELLRSTFDDAVCHFDDGAIDLLHIDGLHTYDAVKHDFESWLPKLSNRAVVLMHDSNEHHDDFGVYRLVAELRQRYDVFEFLHGHGLAVVAVGDAAPAPLRQLCQLDDFRTVAVIRERFASLGIQFEEEWVNSELLVQERAQLDRALEQAAAERSKREAVDTDLETLRSEVETLQNETARLMVDQADERRRTSVASARAVRAEAEARRSQAVSQFAGAVLEGRRLELARVEQELRIARNAVHRSDHQSPLRRLARRAYRATVRGALAADVTSTASAAAEDVDLVRSSDLFDASWYLVTYPEVTAISRDPVEHYLSTGATQGFDPSPLFSSRGYLLANPDVGEAGVNPLVHYLRAGRAEQRHVVIPPSRPPRRRVVLVSGEPDTPGHAYRIERIDGALQANGYATDVIRADELAISVDRLDGIDGLFVWRMPMTGVLSKCIERLRARSCPVVFDIDDLMFEPEIATASIIDGIRSHRIPESAVADLYQCVRQTMLAATVCTAPTDELATRLHVGSKPAMVIRNTFDDETLRTSLLARKLWSRTRDDLFRIGYASGSLTHQRDFMDVAPAVARILRERSDVRLVLFYNADCGPTLDVREFPALAESADSIEWRELVPIRALPNELARFDINLAPLEVDNVFCESKSELKYTEAALVGVPTIASPTGPYRHATHGGKTGLLASSGDEWYEALSRLLDDPALRAELGAAAFRDALARYGPLAAAMEVGSVFETCTSPSRAFASAAARSRLAPREIHLSPAQLVFEADHLDVADVTVAIPLHNYEQFVEEALESVRAQRLEVIDLVVIDDASTDSSLDRVHEWVVVNQDRFNRVALYTNSVNAGLGQTRNALFELSASRYVLPLDADNRLRPDCATRLLEEVASAGVAFAYGTIQQFGDACDVLSSVSFDPRRLARGNYIDAMALVAKEAWAAVGGYDSRRHGWEDFEFWCQLVERGLPGLHVPETLADYRVHSASMLHTLTMVDENYERIVRQFEREFPWLRLALPWDFERRF